MADVATSLTLRERALMAMAAQHAEYELAGRLREGTAGAATVDKDWLNNRLMYHPVGWLVERQGEGEWHEVGSFGRRVRVDSLEDVRTIDASFREWEANDD